MANQSAPIAGQAIVVVFDMCSSSNIVDDLHASAKLHRVHKVTRKLRNIAGGAEFECRRIWLVRPFRASDGPS